jgi:spore photoproduct lyase
MYSPASQNQQAEPPVRARPGPRAWVPRRVLATPAALAFPHGRAILERAAALGSEVVELPSNRLTGLAGKDPRRAYIEAKSTLAVVVAPPGKRKLQPIPPSADWRLDLAEGCPAHCQYCYLAGSLAGPPVTRVYANLDEILHGLEHMSDGAQSLRDRPLGPPRAQRSRRRATRTRSASST